MVDEIWKFIEGSDNKYMVSNLGRFKRLSYTIISKNGVKKHFDEMILKDNIIPNKNAYISIGNKKSHIWADRAHRIVAKHFIPNPDNLPQVNHINGIKYDNRVENLEWVDNTGNMRHAVENELWKAPNRISIKKICIETDIIVSEYESIREAARIEHIDRRLLSRRINQKKPINGFLYIQY